MSALIDDETTFIVGRHTFAVRVGRGHAPREMKVAVTMDGRFEWIFDQPGWRPLSYGTWLDRPYLWSARELIVLPRSSEDNPQVITVDEDLFFVFQVDAGWLLVCETSVRRVVFGTEAARVELADVVERVTWEQDSLVVIDAAGHEIRIRVDGDRLDS